MLKPSRLLVVGGNRRKSESWVASLRSPPRLRATLSIATLDRDVLRTRVVRWIFLQRTSPRSRGDRRLVSERGDLRSFPDFQEGMEVSQR